MRRTLLAILFFIGCGGKDTTVPPPTGSDTPVTPPPSVSAPVASTTASATPTASASTAPVASASASAPVEATLPAFKDTVAGTKAIILVWRPKADSKEGKQV